MGRQFDQIEQQDARVYFDGPVDDTAISSIADLDGVGDVEPSAQLPASVDTQDAPLSTAVVVLPADSKMHGFFTPDGSATSLSAQGSAGSQGILDTADAEVGDTLRVSISGAGTVDVPVAGAVNEPLGSFVYLSFSEASRIAGVSFPATAALVSYDGSVEPAQIRAAVLEVPGVAAFEDTEALAETMRGFMGLFYGFVGVMLAFGAAMAFALIFNAMSVNIAERTREVGTLMAVVSIDRPCHG